MADMRIKRRHPVTKNTEPEAPYKYRNGKKVYRLGKGNVSKSKNFRRTQASNILAKFGGPAKLCATLKEVFPNDPSRHWNISSIARWDYPFDRGGTDGLIPAHALPVVLKAARVAGILITLEDLYPDL